MRDKIVNLNKRVIYIQNKMRNRLSAKRAKIEIFKIKWQRTLFKLNLAACNKHNEPEFNDKIREFTRCIMLTPKSI